MFQADIISGGFVWGSAVAVVFVFIGAVVGYLGRRWAKSCDAFDRGMALATEWGGVAFIVITAIVWLAASWPLKYDYHHWVDVRGRVDRIASRFISAGDNGGTNQRFVFILNGHPYGVDDTRASLAHTGSYVHLRCKKEHQLFQNYSDDGWACRWMNDSEVAR